MELGHRPESDDVRAKTRRTWFRESISIVEELGNFADTVDAAYTRALGATGH